MQAFIIKRQPKAYQGSKTFKSKLSKDKYVDALVTSLNAYNPSFAGYENEELYGVVYYFFNENTGTDADNISKPIWDCLKGALFSDDKQIKLRTGGCFDLQVNDLQLLNFSGLSGEMIADLLDAFDTEKHTVYIECGVLNYNMFKFNMEADGN